MYPPSTGPRIGATTTATPYMAIAMPSCRGGKVSTRMPCSEGWSPPPPSPWRTRKKISSSMLGAAPQRAELIVNSSTQVM